MKYPTQTRPTATPRAIPPVAIPPADSLLPLTIPTDQPLEVPYAALEEPDGTSPRAPEVEPRRSRNLFLSVAVAVALIAAVVLGTVVRSRVRSMAGSSAETATVERENFVSVLRLAGTVDAVKARPVMAPRLAGAQLGSMVVTTLIPAGTKVKMGDLLAEFDRQAQVKDYLDKQASYQDFADQVIEKQAAEDAARAKDETELTEAEDDLAKARLEVSKNDILSRIDAEKNTETLQEAEAKLKQLQQTFKLKREAAAAGIHTLGIQRDRARATMRYAEENSQKMVVRSPMDGVVVLNSIWVGGTRGLADPQPGDQIWPGVAFLKVVDLSAMAVTTQVNQEDLPNLHIGQHALIHLDAYPGISLPGVLEELAPLGQMSQFSDKVRTFAATFSIEGASPKLMPDLTASVDAELATAKDATVVPIQSVATKDGTASVWIKSGMGFDKRVVQVGPRNDLVAVITSGLRPGDIVLKNAPEEAPAVNSPGPIAQTEPK